MYQLKDDNENDQKNLATKSETTEFTQLREEEDRAAVLKDVKKFLPKRRKYFSYVHSWQKKELILQGEIKDSS